MRISVFTLLLTFILLASTGSSLESGTVFSVQPGTGYKCVHINLPQDLGMSSLNETTETIIEVDKGESPWADMTYSKVVMEPGVINKNPFCFYYSDKNEGDFSFYRIDLSSHDLGVSGSISGGLCVSDYEDVDTGVETENETDICGMLSENADIIDLSFKEDVTQAKLGEIVTKTLYITSYANLRIRLSIATNLQNDFDESVVTASPSNPTAQKTFKVKAPEREGDFEIFVRAQAEDCYIQACKKQKKSVLSVTTKEKKGFSVSVVPKNINLKEARETTFKVIISNYEKSQDFLIEASSDPSLGIEPESKTVRVDKNGEKTAVFKALPGEEDMYKIEFKITTEKTEKLLTSYLSVGELLTDGFRYAEASERASTPDIRDEMRKAREEYEKRYNETSYGEDIDDYEDFIDTIDELKKKGSGNGGNGKKEDGKPEEGGFNWLFLAIPIIVIVVIALLFVAYKKSKVAGSGGYSGYEYSRI
ncbi:MAG: hypothetical protein V3U72_02595 [Candidatus Aenigmarchaeota archaeon]